MAKQVQSKRPGPPGLNIIEQDEQHQTGKNINKKTTQNEHKKNSEYKESKGIRINFEEDNNKI